MGLRKVSRKHSMLVSWGVLLSGALVAPACSNEVNVVSEKPQAGGESPGVSYATGKFSDLQNGVVVELPAGWQALVPEAGVGLIGTTTLVSYDMRALDTTPLGEGREAHSIHVVPLDVIKADLTAFDLEGRSVEQWVQQRLDAMSASPDGVNALGMIGMMRSEVIPFRLAERDGYAYRLQNQQFSSLVVDLPWDDGKVMHVAIGPADSYKLEDLMPVLDQMRSVAQERDSQGMRSAARAGTELAAPLKELQSRIAMGDVSAMGACTGWTGSDNGNCTTGSSCASNTPITLNLPFQVGTNWEAGGAGSFFGNGAHGNCNWDYYAIDFNMKGSGCSGYVEDSGQNVYAAHGGTAYVGYQSGGYGNYVDVVHSTGVRTRYAHLSTVSVSNGQQNISTQTIVGKVGATGQTGMAPHLHMGLYNSSSQSFCNKSGGCPNGEAARSPQTVKPSPMYTYTGSKAITDFGCYQAPP